MTATRLSAQRLGRVSMRPPLARRHIDVETWERIRPDHRSITCVDRDRPGGRCAWCEIEKRLYRYAPRDFNHEFIDCCSWSCFHQWMLYHEKVTDELDVWFALGIWPEHIPTWYLSNEVREGLAQAARDRIAVKLARDSVRERGLTRPTRYNQKRMVV